MQLYISRNNQQAGPFEKAKVLQMLQYGQLLPTDLAIGQGESQWQVLEKMFPNVGNAQVKPIEEKQKHVRKSRKGLLVVCLILMIIGVSIIGVVGFIGYRTMYPSPTGIEVPETIGKFRKEKLESSTGDLLGRNKGFTATYLLNENDKQTRLKYYFHSFNNTLLPMLWEDIKCTGKYEDESRIVSFSSQIGKIYYCNSETPFVEVSYDKYAVTLAPESKDIPAKNLEEMALGLIPHEKEIKLVPFK